MSAKTKPSQRARRHRRADAERNLGAILDTATQVLSQRPDASIDDIAKAAGVARQTVYAHYASRDALVKAVVERASRDVFTAIENARLDARPPAEALLALLDAGSKAAEYFPLMFHLPAVSPEEDRDRHGPIFGALEDIIRRGQASGEFDPGLSTDWIIAAMIALGSAAEQEVRSARMTVDEATATIRRSLLRLVGEGRNATAQSTKV